MNNSYAYCFFTTKQKTDLSFLFHAPFLLNSNRESIPEKQDLKIKDDNGKEYIVKKDFNEILIEQLAQLAADSLIILRDLKLIDDDIIRIIPYKQPTQFFAPFYEKIKAKFQTEELLPSLNGEFTPKENAYWAVSPDLTDLFTNEQLAQLVKNENAKWVFSTIGRTKDNEITDYIDGGGKKEYDAKTYSYKTTEPNLIKSNLDFENKIANFINADFIQNQSFEWLHKFYEYLSERKSYQEKFKTKPIFIDTKGNAVPAFKPDGTTPILFLPTTDESSPHIHISEELYEKTKDVIPFEIKLPELKNEIDRISESSAENIIKNFSMLFNYYKQCRDEKFIESIEDKKIIVYKAHEEKGFTKASELYYPSDELQKYFETKPNTKFVDLEYYQDFDKEILKEFLLKIGISKLPRILERKLTDEEKKKLNLPNSTQSNSWHDYNNRTEETVEKYIDGSQENIANINSGKSILLWKYLLQYINLKNELVGTHSYFNRNRKNVSFESSDLTRLKKEKWLFTKREEFVAPHKITINELAEGYESNEQLEKLLEFNSVSVLSEEEQKLKFLTENNISLSDLREYQKWRNRQNAPRTNLEHNPYSNSDDDNEQAPTNETIRKINEIKNSPKPQETEKQNLESTTEETEDEDNYIKPSVDFEKKKKQLEEKAAAEIEEITKIEKLTRIAEESEKYSFAWFRALLELEYLNSSETNCSGKEISIRFAKAELEKGTERTLVLKNLVAPRYIPIAIEEIGDIRMKISYGKDESKTVTAEVVNVKEFTLRCKLKNASDIKDIDLEKITSVQIDIKNPIFILEQLLSQFKSLPFEDNKNLKTDLTPNIEFIFGPPGTGKTTYLARNVLIPKMQEKEDLKILVLTPTNKAADVLIKRIMQECGDDESFYNWLVRFGITQDEEIQQSTIFKEKNFDIRKFTRNVTVTTIARFPYDSFTPENCDFPLHLQQLEWDYIVIDEASMIMLAQIMYPLCYKCDSQFIIAGDPFQIQPITSVENWKDENIYTLVELKNFAKPSTVPHNYNIINLETQYRSVPSIGEVFSQFTYNGILKHNRIEESQRPLNIDSLTPKSLNLIKFPVSRWEGIYRSKRLNNTPYHIYSALFTYEFAKYLSAQITKNHTEVYRIGIICPYRAQASLIDKLISTDRSFQGFENVELQVGTIHGFQGDECDVIVSLFNPPPTISSETHEKGKNMFLHKQNILNVSISRARDYLFVLMPDNETENLFNLKKINKIENLITQSEHLEIHSHKIEEIIFGKRDYLEENTFATTHQNVNVYSEAEKLYEIRCEETAIDVQIKPTAKKK